MGSESVQGPHWGARAEDWAEVNEPGLAPFYEAVLVASSRRTPSASTGPVTS